MSIVWIPQHNCETQHYEGFLHEVGFLDHAKKIRQCQFLPWKKNKFIFAAWPLAPLSHYFQQRFVSFLNFCPLDNIWFKNCVIAMATTNTLYFSTWRKKKISCTMLLDLKELLRIMLIFLLQEFAWSNQICAVSVKNYWGLIELADLAMNRI